MTLPPGVNQDNFSRALQGFENAVGADWVFTKEEDLTLYKDAYSPYWGEEEEKLTSAAVAPDNAEEVAAVVKVANQYKIPIYPISTGKNLGYGGSAPVLSGSVVLDLKRMNRILEVNDRNFSCLVEPGVSYFDLYNYIEENGYNLWIDAPDPGWGSLIGNALDHGCGYTSTEFRDHFGSHVGMEVVLANGEIVRTGMGALPGAKTWQEYWYGYGPSVDGIFSQSNFGVVTKMGFKMMPKPDAYRRGFITAYNREDIIPLVDTQNFLECSGICNGLPDFSSPLLSSARVPALDEEHNALLTTPGGPDMSELSRYGKRKNVPWWRTQLQFYGPDKVVDEQWQYAKAKFNEIKGVKLEDGPKYIFPLTDEQKKHEHLVDFGIPNLQIFFVGARSELNDDPDDGHIWFSPMIPKSGEALLEAQEFFGKALYEYGIDLRGFDVAPSCYFRNSFMLLFGFPIRKDVKKNQQTRAAFKQIVKLAASKGWGEYRTAPAFMDDVMAVYNYNDHALLKMHHTLKDAIDPNGIISAGRSGIWPKHMRDA